MNQEDDTLMVDLGSGALANMLSIIDADALGGLAITHMHYDHYVDIYGLCNARRFWDTSLEALPTLAPANAREIIESPLSEKSRPEFMKSLDLIAAEPGVEREIAGFTVLPQPSKHEVGGMIYRIDAGGSTVCYTGDTDICDELLEQADGADLLICEATFTSEVPLKHPGHLTASEAGKVALEAGVGRLMLTHIWPTLDVQRALVDASEHYKGPVDLAVEGLAVFVGPFPCAV
jgi:ribonuclease BN (tRNA processing enzyme)